MADDTPTGRDAIEVKGWLGAHRWLLLRRLSQLSILGLFLLGPLSGIWIVKGNLASSLTLDVLPLTDPYVLLQALAARHWPEMTAIVGSLIIVGFYLMAGGRAYCSWVCPINPVTDLASWLRRRLGLKGGAHLNRGTRHWVLAMSLVMSALFGVIIWEFVNPVSMFQRGLLFGMGSAWAIVLGVFFFDLFVSNNGWCGHVCPVGAFYSLIGRASLVRVSASGRAACNDCMDCFTLCPEPQIIAPALYGERRGRHAGNDALIRSSQCTNCGRCIDVCAEDVFHFDHRFATRTKAAPPPTPAPHTPPDNPTA